MRRSLTLAGALAVGCALVAAPLASQAAIADTGKGGTEVFTTVGADGKPLPDLATFGGVGVKASAYGSAVVAKPGSTTEFYGLTDRGPNVDSPDGKSKIEPIPDYAPQIGLFRMDAGHAILEKTILLRGTDGKTMNGQVSPEADTGETITDLDGKVLPKSVDGYDSEGLVAAPDGTFYVSDEYGPYITHFAADGSMIGRLSPFDGTLPGELKMRDPNKGMEGLTMTPDGKTVVGMMQSALVTPDLTKKPKNVVPVRIVTIDIASGKTHEYLFMRHLDSAETNVSEITAISATKFLIDERDGKLEPGAYKRLYLADITNATDVGPASTVAGASYDATKGGLLVGGKSIEGLVGKAGEKDAAAALAAAKITPAASALYLDVAALVTGIDGSGNYFGHDKVEGVAALFGGQRLTISNDSDYGLGGATGTAPFQLEPKNLPNGQQDDGEFMNVTMANVAPAAVGPGYTALAAPSMTAKATTGANSRTVTVAGQNFEPGVTYSVVLHSDPVTLGTVTPAADGTIAPTDFAVPNTVPAGDHAVDLVAANGVVTAEAPVTLDAFAVPTTPAPSASAAPGGQATPTASASAPAAKQAPSATPTRAANQAGELPYTGFTGLPILIGSLLAAAVGVGLLLLERNRRLHG